MLMNKHVTSDINCSRGRRSKPSTITNKSVFNEKSGVIGTKTAGNPHDVSFKMFGFVSNKLLRVRKKSKSESGAFL